MWTFSKGLCILRSITRIMVKTYNCICNRNMYLWWCSNIYKRLQSFIWRYFYCTFLRSCLGIDSNVRPGVGKFGCIWLEWCARGQGIWLQIFEKSQIPTTCPPCPPPPSRHYIDRCIRVTNINFVLTASTHYQIEKVMRICKVKTRGEVLWSFIQFSQRLL